MSISTVESVVARFLSTEKPEVLSLKGQWGVGKSYAWNSLLSRNKSHVKLKRYCYVSLFGVSSMAELRMAIFTKSQNVESISGSSSAGVSSSKWTRATLRKFKVMLGQANGFIKELPYGKNITVALETMAPFLVRDTLICFDDFERLGPAGVKPEEILGLISELKEERCCKVVLIFNEEKLDPEGCYATYREKVIDLEVVYDPTAEESTAIALPRSLPFRGEIEKNCTALGIKNIRILKKIVDLTELIHPEAAQLHATVLNQIIHTLVLATWCYFDSQDQTPPLDFLKIWSGYTSTNEENHEGHDDEQQSGWSKLFQAYGLTDIDELDLSIIAIVEKGYLDGSGFGASAARKDTEVRSAEQKQSYFDSWSLFHNSFENNEEELIAAMSNAVRRSAAYLTPTNLNSAVGLLRELDRNVLADELVDVYVRARADEDELFDLAKSPVGREISDQKIVVEFANKLATKRRPVSLRDAAVFVAEHNGWSKEHLEALRRATSNDFYELFTTYEGEELQRIIGACTRFRDVGEHRAIGDNAHRALVRIGRESRLNAIRVQQYGVTAKELEGHTSYS